MSTNVPITVAYGDCIGPEIMEASLHIIQETGAPTAQKANGEGLELTMIDNRGVKVWPEGISETLLTDAYRRRFTAKNGGTTAKKTVALLDRVLEQGLEIVKTETLRSYNGTAGYSLSQGQ